MSILAAYFWTISSAPTKYNVAFNCLNLFEVFIIQIGATKVAIYVMQQELFAWPLLNFLATRALLQWAELPASERLFSDEIHPRRIATLEEETSFNEENVVGWV